MRACAEMAESAVPATEMPRLPRNRTSRSQWKCREDRHVVENGEDREHQQFGEHEEQRVGDELGEKNGEGIGDGQAQRAERVVILLAKKTGLQHQGCGEKKGQPKQTATEAARFRGGGIKGEAEQNDDHRG